MREQTTDTVPRVVVPADIGTPDRIAWGLSFRQLVILGAGNSAVWVAYSHAGPLLPLPVWVGIAIVVAGTSAVLALGRRDGLPLDIWLRHGLLLRRGQRLATPGHPATGANLLDVAGPVAVPAPLRAAATSIRRDGTLTVEGTDRVVIACGTTGVGLRTGTEQASLLEAFGRWLNALTHPAQLVVTATRHDLTPHAITLLDAAARLPHPALRDAATDHAAFLLDLDECREPLRRQVLAVITGPRAREGSVRGLTAIGITARPLDGPAVVAALAGALDPFDPPVPGPRAVPGVPITTRRHP